MIDPGSKCPLPSPPAPRPAGDMPRWLLFSLLTVLLWGGWGFAARKIGDALPAEHTAAMSSLGLLPVIVFLAASSFILRPLGLPGSRSGALLAFLSGLLGAVGNLAFYHLLGLGEKASTIVPLSSMYPLVTILLALIFLRERLSRAQWVGLGLALAAIYLFNVSHEGHILNPWLAEAMLPAALWGASALLQKVATNRLPARACTLWFLIGLLPVAVFLWLAHPVPAGLGPGMWLWTLAVGLTLGLGNLTLLTAYASEGKVSVITPLAGLYPVVTVPLALLFLGERISLREGVAILVSFLAVIALSFERSGKRAVSGASQALAGDQTAEP